jgi:hypothetical protein
MENLMYSKTNAVHQLYTRDGFCLKIDILYIDILADLTSP